MKKIFFLILFIAPLCNYAQDTGVNLAVDSAKQSRYIDTVITKTEKKKNVKSLHVKSFILPAAMVSYGILAMHNGELKELSTDTRNELQEDHAGFHTSVDNYLQFAPAAAVFTLQGFGIKGKHSVKDEAFLYATCLGVTTAVSYPMKKLFHEPRPNGEDYNSFPSGHTATAFASAEFLRREYKDVSVWYGVAGYGAAAATAALRMYNNKHWLNDVIAGAGIGIASTTFSYWLYDNYLMRYTKKHHAKAMVYPFYNDHNFGVGLVKVL